MPDFALLYLRFSPRPNAEDARSLEVQEDRCRAYCDMHGLTVAHVVRDPETSARTVSLDDRDGGQELLRLIRSGGIKHIVVQKLDRIFRSLDGRVWMDRWGKAGVALHLADQGGCSINTSTAVGRFLAGQLLLVAELEPSLTSERTSDSMRFRQTEGQAMSKHAPYGFMEGPVVNDKRTWVESPIEQATIARVRLLSAEGLGVRAIASTLQREGIPPRGKRWHHQTVQKMLDRQNG
jgi:DNA invertase Pin-like site-specific DNA recombinase